MNYDLHIFNSRHRFEEANGDHLKADHHIQAHPFEGVVSSGYNISVTWPALYDVNQTMIKNPVGPFVVAEVTEILGSPSLILYYDGSETWY